MPVSREATESNARLNRGLPALARFEAKFIPEPNSGCWLWTASVNRYGYGVFYLLKQERQIAASRASWLLYRGAIEKGMCVMHVCDVRCCVNPNHLRLGTHSENMADMARKGRGVVGVKHPGSRLTPEQVKRIRAGMRLRDAKKEFGIGQNAFYKALRHQSYRDI